MQPLAKIFAIALLIASTTALAADEPASTTPPATAASPAKTDNAKKYTLRYQFKPGETIRNRVTQQSKIETTIAGSTQVAEMTSISTKAWKVTEIDDQGKITFETVIENIDMRNKLSGREEVRYNSETDLKAPPGYETAAASIGKVLTTITIDPAGKLLKRVKQNQKTVDADDGAQVVVPLPEGPVAVGGYWSVPIPIKYSLDKKSVLTLNAKVRYELMKVDGNIAEIAVETVLPPVKDPAVMAQVMQRLTNGKIRFDLAAGRIVSQQSDLDERVVGFSGPESSLHYLGRFTENLTPAGEK
ncbi:MAG: hypothetical protein SGJ20_18905, partial [Planctomycetota bacterium]|nr:hypothetical protein [Planctomycetota bacterium]